MMGSETETLAKVRVEEIQGKGRGVVSAQPLKGGDVILTDSPIVLYPDFPLSSVHHGYCDTCFKKLQSTAVVSCSSCSLHHFCSPNCLSAAPFSPWVCQALSHLRDCPSFLHHPLDRQVQARLLIAACNLAMVSPANFQTLLSLRGESRADDEDALFLHSLISSLCPPPSPVADFFSFELTSALLAKDKLNAFGLMEPFDENAGGDRSVRAYGIYPKASFFNHDCLPNACRFDYVDTHNTDVIIRMIHDVPQGREICLSYLCINDSYSTRQKRLLGDYGFNCDCDRCKVEANWSDGEEEEANDDEAMDEDPDESMADEEEEENAAPEDDTSFPHAYFFVRYVCDRENCGGTLAPTNANSYVLECNVCGSMKTDEVGVHAAADGQTSLS